MIIIKCDICDKQDKDINTLILHKKKIDYCNNPKCIEVINKIKEEFQKEVKLQNIYFDIALKEKETKLIRGIRENNQGGKHG